MKDSIIPVEDLLLILFIGADTATDLALEANIRTWSMVYIIVGYIIAVAIIQCTYGFLASGAFYHFILWAFAIPLLLTIYTLEWLRKRRIKV